MGAACTTPEQEQEQMEQASSYRVKMTITEKARAGDEELMQLEVPQFHEEHLAKYDRGADYHVKDVHQEDHLHHVQVMGNPEEYMYAFVKKGWHEVDRLCLYPDVKPLPPHRVIKGFKWTTAKEGHGSLQFPTGYTGDVPICVATDSYLSFFGCRFAEHLKQKVELKVDHEVMDFNYHDYKKKWVMNPKLGAGGVGLERHEFIHMECPMSHDSGLFLLAHIKKKEDGEVDEDEMYLTAFRIPAFHTVYIAPHAIHSNDHMEGLWRTMLSSFSEEESKAGKNYIDHALCKSATGKNLDLQFLPCSQFRVLPNSKEDALGEARCSTKAMIHNSKESAKVLATTLLNNTSEKWWHLEEVTQEYAHCVKRMGHGLKDHICVMPKDHDIVKTLEQRQADKAVVEAAVAAEK